MIKLKPLILLVVFLLVIFGIAIYWEYTKMLCVSIAKGYANSHAPNYDNDIIDNIFQSCLIKRTSYLLLLAIPLVLFALLKDGKSITASGKFKVKDFA